MRTTMSSVRYFILVLLFVGINSEDGNTVGIIKSIRECLKTNQSIMCIKERALKLIDEAIISDKPMKVLEYVDIERNPNYAPNITDLTTLPRDLKERNEKLNDIILEKVDEYFESRTLKLNLGGLFEEGRAKKASKKGGGMMMMAGLAMAGMMAQMAMGKIAMMAGAALMMSKMALMMSSIIGLKKLVGGGGGGGSEPAHVVYTSSGGSDHGGGGGGGGGGWHRSLNDEDAAIAAYRAYSQRQNDIV